MFRNVIQSLLLYLPLVKLSLQAVHGPATVGPVRIISDLVRAPDISNGGVYIAVPLRVIPRIVLKVY